MIGQLHALNTLSQCKSPLHQWRILIRVDYAALYPSAEPYLQIRIRHWTDTHYTGGCVGCTGRFAEVRNLVVQAGIEKRLLRFPARNLSRCICYAIPTSIESQRSQIGTELKRPIH